MSQSIFLNKSELMFVDFITLINRTLNKSLILLKSFFEIITDNKDSFNTNKVIKFN